MQKELEEIFNDENGEKLLNYFDYISKNENEKQMFIGKIHNLQNIGVKNILFVIKILNTSIDFNFQNKKNFFSELLEIIILKIINNDDNKIFFQTIPSFSLLLLSNLIKNFYLNEIEEKEKILINFIEKYLINIIPINEIGKIFFFNEENNEKLKKLYDNIKKLYTKTDNLSYNSFYEILYKFFKQKNSKIKYFSFQKVSKKTFNLNKMESIFSVKPIPKENLIFYFECYLISLFKEDDFSFGLSKSHENKDLFICYKNSGKIIYNERVMRLTQEYNRNDIVGCLINKIDKCIIFIKNGEQKIKLNYTFGKDEELYPGILLCKCGYFNIQLNNNFQSYPFCFNYQKYLDDFLNNYYDSIIKVDINNKNENELFFDNNSQLDLLICDYMLYNAYLDSYNEMKTITYGKKAKHMNNLKIEIRKKIRELLEEKKFDEINDLIQKNFTNYESSIKILNFYKTYYEIYNDFMDDYNKNSPEIISNLIINLRQKIIFNENYLDIYKKLYKTSTEKLLHNVFNPKLENQVNIDAINNFINETLSSDEMFSNINSEILKSNYSIYLNEIESILKNLILVLCKNLDLNPISGINFILTYPNFLNVLNEKLIKLGLSCEEIQMEKFFIEYFENLTIYDKI
jgi:hypothetical protein